MSAQQEFNDLCRLLKHSLDRVTGLLDDIEESYQAGDDVAMMDAVAEARQVINGKNTE